MTEAAVNDWLKHWLTRQQKSKRPLILKDPSRPGATAKDIQSGTGRPTNRIEWVEPDEGGIEDGKDDTAADEDWDTEDIPATFGNGPDAPETFAQSRKSRQAFLSTLSADAKYRQLLLLMNSAKVGSVVIY